MATEKGLAQVLEEINEQRRRLNEFESWLKSNAQKFKGVRRLSTNLKDSKPTVYLWAGENPIEIAKQFGASFRVHGETWDAEFPDFYLVFMEAEQPRDVVL